MPANDKQCQFCSIILSKKSHVTRHHLTCAIKKINEIPPIVQLANERDLLAAECEKLRKQRCEKLRKRKKTKVIVVYSQDRPTYEQIMDIKALKRSSDLREVVLKNYKKSTSTIGVLKSEKECRGIISALTSTSLKTYHFNKAHYDMGGLRKYELDCYDEVTLEDGTTTKIALEYDGMQHRAICIFAPTQELLDKQIARDLYKNDWCCTNGIYLLRVSDLVPQKQRFEVIRDFLIGLNVPINNITKEQVLEIEIQAFMEATGELEREII